MRTSLPLCLSVVRAAVSCVALLLVALVGVGCTTFFDTDTDGVDLDALGAGDVGGDAATDAGTGACCIGGATCQENLTESACAGVSGVFSAGQTCEQSGCVPTCRQYCAEFIDVCSGFADLARRDWCNEFCETHSGWQPGANGDESGNTIGCRIYHTQAALESLDDIGRAFHCGHSGMSGGDICGTWCANYCTMAMTICTGEDAIYSEFEECVTACGEFPDDGEIGDTAGDTVQCRIYHLGAAAESGNTTTHCPHASAPSADNTCVN